MTTFLIITALNFLELAPVLSACRQLLLRCIYARELLNSGIEHSDDFNALAKFSIAINSWCSGLGLRIAQGCPSYCRQNQCHDITDEQTLFAVMTVK
ncbi:hypothetical protein T10_5337 [Trichinella papuae]|uniref:Secreted protein n=1 Tax=Trichinella papuae TaxID=268474 RepID=A0A0V1MLD5_9BILA|nr:hypothetical protein T10_5337 [Trichinella papuae]